MKRNITVMGGGTGSFNVLSALRSVEEIQIRSIVTMMDSGGDSGRLRDEFGVLPPGDARRCLVALSDEGPEMRLLFNHRFEGASLEGRSLGNLFFVAATEIWGKERATDVLGKILKVRGGVIEVTLDAAHLCAVLEDGRIIEGESKIDVPEHDPSIPIREVYLTPEASINPKAHDAIFASDCIILAPGNLFTSTVPNLLVRGVPEAIQSTGAKLVYLLNLMTVHGETTGYTASRHVEEVIRYAGRVPDLVIAHDGPVPRGLASRYEVEEASQVEVDEEGLRMLGVGELRRYDLMSTQSFVRHDPEKTARALAEVIGELGAPRG